jgi:hypothetical protein
MKSLTTRLRLASLLSVILLACTAAYGQLTPSADAYTNTADPTVNYGVKPVLAVGSSQTAYIRFNLSSIPSTYTGADITKATLKLYVNAVSATGSFNVDYVNGSWTESTITANNAPGLGTTIAGNVSLVTADKNQYILIDITPAMQAWLNGSEPNDGIALVGNSPVNATFDSKESATQSHPAELVIVFAAGSGGITGITTATGSGLIGGGNSGTLNLSLLNSCGSKQVLQWNGSAWACASAGTGTVTSVASGAGLTGGPITASGTLSIATAGVSNSMLVNPSLTVSAGTALTGGGGVALGGSTTLSLDTSKVPLLAAANTFSTNQTVNGTVTASSFSGNGAALTNVTAVNSSELGGLGSSAYAQLAAANTFSNNQTLNGTLIALSAGNTIFATTTNASVPGVEGVGQANGVLGYAGTVTGETFGMVGEAASTSGVGVGGYALASTGLSFGVYGSSSSTSGTGVYGTSPDIGVVGAGSNIGAYGVGRSASVEGKGIGHEGVWGVWGDTGGGPELFAGVLGTADNAVSGIFLNASSVSPTIAIENDDMHLGDEVFSAVMAGVGATATIGDPGCNTGFIALQLGPAGMANCNNYTLTGGVNGDTYINAEAGSGVHIRVNSVEQLEATSGNISISGNLNVSGNKNFRIDHPLDPANKYLFHAAIESSEVLNLYSGNVVLDASGEAVVQLPDWFEVINKNFRYQLTPIGAPGRDIYIAEEVSGGHFKIAGGKPNGKVSWQVSGVRNDAWEKAHPMVVEADKGAKRGQYLTPELYGAPETARIGYMAPAPGREKIVHHRPAIQKRGNASPSQHLMPPTTPVPPTPVVPKVSSPRPSVRASKLEVNQK